jgi:proteasome lid subunit RPN8/RPN11
MIWAVLIVIVLAGFSYPSELDRASGASWWPFIFWCIVAVVLGVFNRLA